MGMALSLARMFKVQQPKNTTMQSSIDYANTHKRMLMATACAMSPYRSCCAVLGMHADLCVLDRGELLKQAEAAVEAR